MPAVVWLSRSRKTSGYLRNSYRYIVTLSTRTGGKPMVSVQSVMKSSNIPSTAGKSAHSTPSQAARTARYTAMNPEKGKRSGK